MSSGIKVLLNRTLSTRPNRRWSALALKSYINSDLGWHVDKSYTQPVAPTSPRLPSPPEK